MLLSLYFSEVNGQFNYETNKYEMRRPNAYYLSENWFSYTIKPTKEGSLRELFDAGLSPGYTSMARNTNLDLKHARLNFILAGGQALPQFAAEQGRVTVTRAGLLRLRFISQPLSVEEAKSTMLEWLPFFSEKRHKTVAQLDDFLSKVAADYSGYDDRDFGAAPKGFGGGWKDENGVGYGIRFQKAYNEVLPVRIHFNVVWHYVRSDNEERDFFDGPIPDPEGYEIPTLKSWGPDDTSEMMRAKGIPFPEWMSAAETGGKVVEVTGELEPNTRPESKPRTKPKVVDDKTPAPEQKPSRLPWIIAGVLLVGILLLLLKTLLGKSTS